MSDRAVSSVRRARRTGTLLNAGAFLAAVITIALVVCYFAYRPEGRFTFDATKTRAYSLSPQTRELLGGLEGAWTIALILVEEEVDSATRQQVNEVLRRYKQASDNIDIVRVDPGDPETLVDYDALIARLRTTEKELVDRYEAALDDGVGAFTDFQAFAQEHVGRLEPIQLALADGDAAGSLQQMMTLLALVAGEGGQVLDLIEQSLAITDAQPIPNYEVARSVLGEALAQWGDQLYDMASIVSAWRQDPQSDRNLVRYARDVGDAYEALARRLAETSEPLVTLPELELSSIGRQLLRGEALVVIGPDRSAVVPSEQLFPNVNMRGLGSDSIAFDRRFRGEQVVSAAIRSLQVPVMPMVVFVHAEPKSMLRPNERNADLVGVSTVLKASRYQVREWSVGTTDRPSPPHDQPVVWCVIPPLRRTTLEPEKRELALIRAVETLIADGQPVLVNVNPSLLPRYRQEDPWQRVAAPFGLRPDTGEAIFEATPGPDGELHYQTGQRLRTFPDAHPICGALNGQETSLGLPVPIIAADGLPADVSHATIARVEASPRRWLDPDWARKIKAQDGPVEAGPGLEADVVIAVAAERRDPIGAGRQRFMIVGSGGWMLSAVADSVTGIGGGRVALNHPGNQELMLSSIAWLAGLDELIATSPVSQQVARLDGIDSAVALRWGVIAVLVTPIGCILLGFGIALLRRV